MMLQFPAAIYLLVALLIPIIIHLFNRGELGITDFSALKWLTASKHHHWRRIVVRDLLLLLLRILIFTLLVFWLANPLVSSKTEQQGLLYRLVHPDLTASDLSTLSLDIEQPDKIVYLKNDILESKNNVIAHTQNIWSLLSDFDKSLGAKDRLQIIVPAQISFAGERPQLTHQFSWNVIATKTQQPSNNNLWLPEEVIFISATSRAEDRQYLKQLFNSWSNYFKVDIQLSEYSERTKLPANKRILIINLANALSESEREVYQQSNIILLEEYADSLTRSNTSIHTNTGSVLYQGAFDHTMDDSLGRIVWQTEDNAAVIRERSMPAGRWLILYSRFSSNNLPLLTNNTFSRHLLNLLQPEISSVVYQQKLAATDAKPVLLKTSSSEKLTNETSKTLQSLRNLIMLCALLLLLIERLISEVRRQHAH